MSSFEGYEDLVLCELCEQFQDIDQVLSKQLIKHYSSYTELCQSAESGCQLCQAFVRGYKVHAAAHHKANSELQHDFDRDMDVEESQITCVPQGRTLRRGWSISFPLLEAVLLTIFCR
jgi:hypothetical protein